MPAPSRKKSSARTKIPATGPSGIGIGTASGVAAGTATGAAIGTAVGGPLGTAVGGILGAIAGAFAGNEIAHIIDPESEDRFWESSYSTRPYVEKNASYTQYRPAYRYGVTAATKTEGKTFEEVEADLRKNWSHSHGKSDLAWENAKPAVRDAYDRVRTLHQEQRITQHATSTSAAVEVGQEVVTNPPTQRIPVEGKETDTKRRAAHRRSRRGVVAKTNVRSEK